MEAWETLQSKVLLERPWMKLREDRVRLPTGSIVDEFHVIEYPDWACVCCVTEGGKIVLVEQYRYGVARLSLELPAGEIGDGEEPLTAAKRELMEETGYEASTWHPLGRCAPNPSKHTSYAHLFIAHGGRKISEQQLDDSEDIRVTLMDRAELMALAEDGGITHGIHITTLFWAARKGLI